MRSLQRGLSCMTINSFDDERCHSISENIKLIRERISTSAIKSGRSYEDIKLMAVTKTVPVEYINYSIDNCGIDLIGENKTLLQGMRKIKFCANGYHCVRVGRHVYYADASGNDVSRGEFIEKHNK